MCKLIFVKTNLANKYNNLMTGELYTSAAEDAMKCGKGKLATKYYMQAEECWYDN